MFVSICKVPSDKDPNNEKGDDGKVLKKLNEFQTRITRKTPKFKFEILMSWLEQTAIDEVLKRQAKSKRLSKLLKPSAHLEEKEAVTGYVGLGLSIAKSCLIGQDPFGDKPDLPESCYKNAKGDQTTDEEVTVSETLSSAAATTGGKQAETQPTPEKRKEYTAEGILLKAVQTECRDLIKVLIYYLIDADLALVLRKREKAYRNNAVLKANTPRGCMPWKEYKELLEQRRDAFGALLAEVIESRLIVLGLQQPSNGTTNARNHNVKDHPEQGH